MKTAFNTNQKTFKGCCVRTYVYEFFTEKDPKRIDEKISDIYGNTCHNTFSYM